MERRRSSRGRVARLVAALALGVLTLPLGAIVTATSAAPVQAAAATTLRVTAPAAATAGVGFSIVVSARSPNGAIVGTYRGEIAFTSDDPRTPVLPGRYTFTAADGGTHTFTGVSLRGAGTRTITATDTRPVTVVGAGRSGPIVVSPAAVARLAVTAPTTTVAGVAVPVTVLAKDRFFNVNPSYRGTVALTSSDPRMTGTPTSHAFTAADRGGYTFTGVALNLASPPSHTFTATDTAVAALTGTSAPIKVGPGPATHLLVEAPATATAGVRFGFTVTALDSSGNVATGYRGRVNFSTSDNAQGVFFFVPAGISFTAASAGIVRFTPPSGAMLQTPGQQFIVALDGSNSAIGGSALVAVTPAGTSGATAYAWGDNTDGQLGDATMTNRPTPGPVTGGPGWRTVSAGAGHSAAIKTDGSLWTWGLNVAGQLGDGTTTARTAPVRVGTGTDWVAVDAGGAFTLAIKSDGTLWGWGFNNYGQLGDGTTTDVPRLVPGQVGTDTHWASVATGGQHVIAVKTDGTLWAWGWNESGQLGIGTKTAVPVVSPTRAGTTTSWRSAAAGQYHSAAIRTDGTLWSWGDNTRGQLGDGTFSDTVRTAPGRVGSRADWQSVSAGAEYTLAIKSGRTLWAWGSNAWYQLGDGTRDDRSFPTRIGAANSWAQVSAGGQHTLAITDGGTLWAWGRNFEGQIGDGNPATQRPLPVQIGVEGAWLGVAAGGAFSVALRP